MTEITDEDRRAAQGLVRQVIEMLEGGRFGDPACVDPFFEAFASVRLAAEARGEARGAERERALKAERDELWDALFDAIAMMGHCMNLTATAIIGGEVLKAKDVWLRGHHLLLGKPPARHADQGEG